MKNFKDFEETIHDRDFHKEKETYLAAKEAERLEAEKKKAAA